MSIIDNLLVVLDDGNNKNIDEIRVDLPTFSKQIISASLGRIISKGLITKDNKGYYQIKQTGEDLNTEILSCTNKFNERDNYKNAYFVMFNIPEKERINRDIMRSYLYNNGFGRLHNTVWIGLNINIKSLNNLIKDLKINNKVLIFKATLSQEDLNKLIKQTSWNLQTVIDQYLIFIKKANTFLSSTKKNQINARYLVYEYAKICKQDPVLPSQYLPNDYLKLEQIKIYEKIRTYCN